MTDAAPVVKKAIMLQRSKYVAVCGRLKENTDGMTYTIRRCQ